MCKRKVLLLPSTTVRMYVHPPPPPAHSAARDRSHISFLACFFAILSLPSPSSPFFPPSAFLRLRPFFCPPCLPTRRPPRLLPPPIVLCELFLHRYGRLRKRRQRKGKEKGRQNTPISRDKWAEQGIKATYFFKKKPYLFAV